MPHRLAYPLAERDNRTFSDAEVDALLQADLRRFELGMAHLYPAAIHNQHQFDALVTFAFSVGLGVLQRSTLRQKFNREDVTGGSDEFIKFVCGGSRVLPGLVARRLEEQRLFLTPPIDLKVYCFGASDGTVISSSRKFIKNRTLQSSKDELPYQKMSL